MKINKINYYNNQSIQTSSQQQQFKQMQKELDWLAFSKLSPNNAQNIFQLSSLLKNSTVSPQMFNRLPKSYLIKFFSTIQNELLNYNTNQPQFQKIIEIKSKQRNQIVGVMRELEERVKNSKEDLDQRKRGIAESEQVLERLEKKYEKLKSEKKKHEEKQPVKQVVKEQTFYCPYCRIDGFLNRDNFQNHMLTQHPIRSQQDKMNSMKQVVLALKEKQMALMEMVLKRNQDVVDMNRKISEQEYLLKTRQFQTAQIFANPSIGGESVKTEIEPELASSTSYVWFENNTKKGNQNNLQYDQTNRNEYHQRNNGLTSIPKQTSKGKHNEKVRFQSESYLPYQIQIISPSRIPQTTTLKQEFDLGTRLGLYTTQKQPLKRYKSVTQQCENSLYHTKNLSKISLGGCHVYCSGPLEDDESDSEASDYFNLKVKPRVIDEEIEVPYHLLQKYNNNNNVSILNSGTKNSQNQNINSINYPHQNRSLQTIKTLLSPKSTDKNQKSGINSILFSVEDKDFSLSKDSASINLSDLKYQDLLSKKQQQRKSLNQELGSIQEFIKDESNGFSKEGNSNGFMRKTVVNEVLLSEFYETDINSGIGYQLPMKKVSSYRSGSNSGGSFLLDEFISKNNSFSKRQQSRERGNQSPKSRGKRSEFSKEKVSIVTATNNTNNYPPAPRQKVEKVERLSSRSSEIPPLPKYTTNLPQNIFQLPNHHQANILKMQQSQVNYKQQHTSRNDSEPPTERLILQNLIDLTLIRQQQLQQSIDNKL